MKKYKALIAFVVVAILIVMTTCACKGQNRIGLTFAGNDLAGGIRYDHKFFDQNGVYVSANYGCYRSDLVGYAEHYSVNAGYVRYLAVLNPREFLPYFSLGANANYYNVFRPGKESISDMALFPFSGEWGCGAVINKKLQIGWTHDFLKLDTRLNIQITFGK